MQLVNLTDLTTQLLTIAAVTKVLLELVKNHVPFVKNHKDAKFLVSILIPIACTSTMGISLVETANQVAFYIGTVGAGLVAGLGSNFIHEIMKVLQTLKDLKK